MLRAVLDHPPAVSEHASGNGDSSREVLVDWLMEVAAEYSARPATLALAVSYLDRVLVDLKPPRGDLQLLAVTCMWVACKIEETDPPSIADTVFICDHLYKKEQVLGMEETVLNQLGFKLTLPTHFNVMELIAGRVGQGVEDVVGFAAHLAMMDFRACEYAPGVVALGCVVASCWVAGVEVKEVREAIGEWLWLKWMEEAEEVAQRLFSVWRRIKIKHERDESRWMLIRWADLHERFGECEERGGVCGTFHITQWRVERRKRIAREEREEREDKLMEKLMKLPR